MPQEHYVLRCFSCETFQAHIVKKSKKWECKLCGTKQSLKRNYGKGNGKGCRIQVMRLNELRFTKSNNINPVSSEIFNETFTEDLNVQQTKEYSQVEKALTNKWAKYLEDNIADKDSETDNDCETDFFLHSSGKKKKRVKKDLDNCYSKKRKICSESNGNKVLSQEHQEGMKKSDFYSPSSDQSFDSDKKIQQEAKRDCPNQYENKLKFNKYTKYLVEEENENENENNLKLKKITNIFDSNTADLDTLLNF